ncbi:MAG: dephospho-CoA kinase [Armatimonadetes bacterium]|nr:dephospho-CoA kinase [Armatimonadota bacterium]
MKQSNRPFLIAITGGIASGKTLVSKWFEEKGYKVIYADKIGHKFLDDEDIIDKLMEKFGKEILDNKKINRKKLGQIVFGSKEKLSFLNQLLHPKIRKEMQKIIDECEQLNTCLKNLCQVPILIFEIPLLFENKLEKAFDLVLNISSEKTIQIQRIIKKRKISEKRSKQIIDSQISDFEKQKLADVNIMNNTSLENLFERLENLLQIIKKMKHRNIKRLIEI